MPKPFLLEARDIPQAWKIMVPEYRSARYSPLVLKIEHWEGGYADEIAKVSVRRSESRVENYFIPEEIERVRTKVRSRDSVSIRFGKSKKGHGYHGERGDFCLVGGSIENRHLTLFYRSLELIGGFGYDLVLIRRLGQLLDLEWKSLQIFATSAHVFALKKNSNEKFYVHLRRIMDL